MKIIYRNTVDKGIPPSGLLPRPFHAGHGSRGGVSVAKAVLGEIEKNTDVAEGCLAMSVFF